MGGICTRVSGIECRRPKYGEMRIAYKFKTGEYCKRGGGDEFRETRALVPGLKTIGIYYDHPEKHDSKDSRYIFGVVLSEGENNFATDPNLEKTLEHNGFKFTTLPEAENAVQTSFPLCSPDSKISYAIAACKVYKAFGAFIKENQFRWNPAVEVYEREFVHFMIPQSEGAKFSVPEMTYAGTYMGDNEWKEWHQ